jgi:hypothetical protein
MTPDTINFRAATGDSVDRAQPHEALIERLNRYGWRVYLPDGDNVHHVMLARDGTGFVGRCHTHDDGRLRPCKGHKYGAGPCAHLATIWRADFIGTPDTHGEPVSIAHTTDNDVGRTIATDGGRA